MPTYLHRQISDYAPFVLRVGLALMLLWFASHELMNPEMWTNWVPAWATGIFGLSTVTIVTLNGIFELLTGALLLFGIYTRPVAAILFVHMVVIVADIGLSATGVRDAALATAFLALALDNRSVLSLTR